jgi:hypothetical protein
MKGRTDDDKGLPVEIGGDMFRVFPAWKMAQVIVRPLEVTASDEGLLTVAALDVSLSSEWIDESRARAEAEDNLKAAFAERYKPPPCPGDTNFALLLGDLEFGPNNEIVKLLVQIGKLPRAALKEAERLGGELSTDKVKGWVERPADSFKRGEVGQTLRRWGFRL